MIQGYFYDQQIKRYLLQFAAIFAGMEVKVGANSKRGATTIPVPIMMGSMDRVAAAIASGNTQNAHIRLPVMSVNLTGAEYARDRVKGMGTTMRGVDIPYGGDPRLDATVIYQKMAIPYDFVVDLKIKTSNKDQQFQVFEQIAILFTPMVQIQTTDAIHDPGKIVAVELLDFTIDDNYPSGSETRSCEMTFKFKIDGYIQVPIDVRKNLINDVIARVMAVNDPDIGTIFSSGANNRDIPQIFDEMNVPEILIATNRDVDD